jgi:beta-glucosidase
MSLPRLAGMALGAALRPTSRPRTFTREEVEKAAPESAFPRGFLIGCATAGHQVEGGLENDWTEWERTAYPDGKPHINDGTRSGLACDSWNRFDEDVRLLQELGANTYRLGVEWARLEPEEGRWDQAAADRYKSWLEKLNAAGIKPMVTAYHFTLPRWVAADGGWLQERTIDRLEAFTRRLADAFGSLPHLWCTVNEPTVIAIQGFLRGIWPPGLKDEVETAKVVARVMKAHGRMARVLKERTGRPVGLAHHVRLLHPATRSPMDRVIARITSHFVNDAVIDGLRTGRLRLMVPGKITIDEAVAELKGSMDYLGINYYTRDHVRADFKDPSMSRQFVPEGRPKNDLGWDIYPEGLYFTLMHWGRLGFPIYITENGMADNDGARRPEFLRAHLYAVEKALRDGADVRGYYHWSLIDNFEWAEGFTPRFGLYRVDYDDPARKRTPTPAVAVFQELARRITASGKG